MLARLKTLGQGSNWLRLNPNMLWSDRPGFPCGKSGRSYYQGRVRYSELIDRLANL